MINGELTRFVQTMPDTLLAILAAHPLTLRRPAIYRHGESAGLATYTLRYRLRGQRSDRQRSVFLGALGEEQLANIRKLLDGIFQFAVLGILDTPIDRIEKMIKVQWSVLRRDMAGLHELAECCGFRFRGLEFRRTGARGQDIGMQLGYADPCESRYAGLVALHDAFNKAICSVADMRHLPLMVVTLLAADAGYRDSGLKPPARLGRYEASVAALARRENALEKARRRVGWEIAAIRPERAA